MAAFGRLAGLLIVAAAAAAGTVVVAPPALADATLTATPNPVTAGDQVTITGAGFDQCTDPDTEDTTVLLSWLGVNISAVAQGSSGGFTETQAVPPATIPWTYLVVAHCYDASTGAIGPALTGTDVAVQGSWQCTTTCTPVLTLTDSLVHAGDTITVTGSGFLLCTQAQRQLQLLWDDAPWVGGPVPDGSGNFSDSAVVPGNSPAGGHKLGAVCTDPPTDDTIAGAGLAVRVVSAAATSPSASSSATAAASRSSATATQTTSSRPVAAAVPGSSAGPSAGVVSGVSGGLVGALLLGFLLVRAGRRSTTALLGPQQVRAAAAGAVGPPSGRVSPRPGARSVSLRLEPHGDLTGSQQITEADR